MVSKFKQNIQFNDVSVSHQNKQSGNEQIEMMEILNHCPVTVDLDKIRRSSSLPGSQQKLINRNTRRFSQQINDISSSSDPILE